MQERLIDRVTRRPAFDPGAADIEPLLTREWLVTNGLGGYASATVAGVVTRRYHGLLVSALPNPFGRIVMLNHLVEELTLPDGTRAALGGEEYAAGKLEASGAQYLVDFQLEAGLPVWRYRLGGCTIERRVFMPYRQNTVFITYRLVEGDCTVRLSLRPALHFRGYEDPVTTPHEARYQLSAADGHYTVTSEGSTLPPLRFRVVGGAAASTVEPVRMNELLYRVEEARGYAYTGALWSPGCFSMEIAPGATAALVASAEPLDVIDALSPDEALQLELERRRRLLARVPDSLRDAVGGELVLAADQFLIQPAGRLRDRVRAQAVGDEVRTVIAGYHWFTDWGRDTMISLEGLTLSTRRYRESGFILRTFAQYVRDGLIPNMFPDGANDGLYHTADATLWFFHALDRYVALTGDRATLRQLLPTMTDIADHHLRGTHYGIRVDPADGLLHEGQEGYQLTWMDAKMGDWVVTPRRGKPVEINALWYNALCILEEWVRTERGESAAEPYARAAERARTSFNARFWYERGGYLYDVVDGPDGDSTELRPNQILAVSLPHAVLDASRWEAVVSTVERELLTPYGLRSLARGDKDYKPRYFGDLRARDGAYHQGTVWGWLIGPWVDAWLKLHPDEPSDARRFLTALVDHLDEFGVGSVAEIFDAEAPYTPRGCIAQAWSVAELLRCWQRTAPTGTDVQRRGDRAAAFTEGVGGTR
ncbi:glycogen debranching enzyme [Gemmatirosa kalamazoonensis]|uniref:Glycogen debranching enzyme n=1 Tax=Gemmatirosa kalamazoonensis TaxID=861299 RepID=W0RJT4_9BACT|nr:amylo-alpha-1,6-glucosidase [Gemmatirosa kalamazoonensis]AHG91344.1 glycogen debranching enzyme [Gemmatirosa kalamazoonensis]